MRKSHFIAIGGIITLFGSPSVIQQGLTFDGQYLWATGADNIIYQIDIGHIDECEAIYSNVTKRLHIPCLTVQENGNRYEVELRNPYNVISITPK